MAIRAVFFDLGGVILRTEYQAPRQQLAERLGLEYDDLDRIVFDSQTGLQAATGAMTSQQHWEAVMKRLKRPMEEMESIRAEFFAGDIIDRDIVNFLRSLRGTYQTGLISNNWSDLRDYLVREKIIDAFDHIVISAEVGVAKPEAGIYRLALEQAGVRPEEAVFVDDFYVNIEGCEKVGMTGIHFKEADSAMQQLKELLAAGQLR
jgi:epoxide hydrolase-like predicted phosphatase